MPQTRGSGLRTRRLGAAVVVTALAAVATPATGQAQDTTGTLPDETGIGSIDNVIGAARAAKESDTLGMVVTSWALRRSPWPMPTLPST